jgi:hypothetical protein
VLDLFHCRSNPDATLSRFEGFARRIFANKPSNKTFCDAFCTFIRSWFRDSLYDSVVLEDALKDAFGITRRLFGVVNGLATSTKIGITATSVATSRLCIFSNYNGVGARETSAGTDGDAIYDEKLDLGYRLLRPQRSYDEPFLWEVYV